MGDFAINLTPGTINMIEIMLGIIAAMAFRDVANSVIAGLLFFIDRTFLPGDKVYIDDVPAIIISIGIRKTIFRIHDSRGVTWRYVPNERIKLLKLEKIVEDGGLSELDKRVSVLEGRKSK